MTDALNATFITKNGNEGVLQNDMGNALIQDSATGQMMELREGFIPVGMKEHGGILYIVSADKEGNGEIGTIPSPIITWDYAEATGAINDYLIADGKDIYNICQVSTKLHPGEQYVLILNLESGEWNDEKKYFTCPNLGYYDPIETLKAKTTFWVDDYSPIISTVNQKGYYTLNLYACNDYNNYLIDNTTSQQYYRQDQDNIQNSNFWFIPSQILKDSKGKFIPLNQKYMSIDNCFKKFPGSVPAGRLAVKASLENIGRFELVKRAGSLINPSLGESYLPYTMTIKEGDTEMHYTYFSSFRYKSDSSVRVNKLKVKIIKKADQEEEIPIYRYAAGGHQKIDNGILKCAPEREIGITDKEEKYESTDHLINSNQDTSYDFYTFKYDDWYYLQRKVYEEEAENNGFKSFDASKISSDRHGLFYIKSAEYNVWYTMYVEYYDQCDRLLGTYEVEFNPFYNDYIGEGSDEIEVEEKKVQDNLNIFWTLGFENYQLKCSDYNFTHNHSTGDNKNVKDDELNFTINLQDWVSKDAQKKLLYLFNTDCIYANKTRRTFKLNKCNLVKSKYAAYFPFAVYAPYEEYTYDPTYNLIKYFNGVYLNLYIDSETAFKKEAKKNSIYGSMYKKDRYTYQNNNSEDTCYMEPYVDDHLIYGRSHMYTDHGEFHGNYAYDATQELKNSSFKESHNGKITLAISDEDKSVGGRCILGSKIEDNNKDTQIRLVGDGQTQYELNKSKNEIITQINHYYKYTDKDTAEVIKIPGNLKGTGIYKTTLWLGEDNKPYNFVNIKKVLDDNNQEVGIQKSSDLRKKAICPNHSINLDIWADSKLSQAYISPTNIKTYDVVSFQSLNPGTYVINFYGYDVNYTVNKTMTIRLQLGDITIDLTSGQPVVIKLDHQVSKTNIKFVIIPNSPNSVIKQCHAFTDFGIYQTDNVAEMPVNQVCLVSDYKDKIIMPLAETFVENNIVCGDTTFNYEYSPKYAYETNIDMNGNICQYTVKKGVYETYENVASLIEDDKHTSHLDKNNPPIIRFTNE